VKEESGGWQIEETAQTPMGPVSDVILLDKASLALRKRSVKQGPLAIELAFEGGRATGTLAMGGDPKPVAIDLGGELFADGASSHVVGLLRSRKATPPRSATSTCRSRSLRCGS